MRQILLGFALSLTVASWGIAQGNDGSKEDVGGKYTTKFESVSNNCQNTGMNLSNATVEITQKDKRIEVTITMVPNMVGNLGRGGTFKASAKRGKTGIAGLDGQFSVSGKAKPGTIDFLFIAEYFQNDKPLCTQSWNAVGQKQTK